MLMALIAALSAAAAQSAPKPVPATGLVELECVGTPGTMQVSGCRVVSEKPRGKGYGEAALRIRPKLWKPPNDRGGPFRVAMRLWPYDLLPPPPQAGPLPDGARLLAPGEAVFVKRPIDLPRYYPERAREREVEGYAKVRCRVGSDGRLGDCGLMEETPPGAGFGAATARMASDLAVEPVTTSGTSTAGAWIEVPITWRLGQ